jgi:hypothetical protein
MAGGLGGTATGFPLEQPCLPQPWIAHEDSTAKFIPHVAIPLQHLDSLLRQVAVEFLPFRADTNSDAHVLHAGAGWVVGGHEVGFRDPGV